ncbi:MAG: hypothetical protein M1294_03050 [Firmicutes bacterium]|uniref:Uncharacterized protein n=1 Tax=Sulfobacillus benefaciens TaxID=453960 RepID=A0A2T2XBC7_9FIRM|nr:hypothetical protein [Bacillota bacterium]MCL5012421.1 hypothetical protein [Bacillota bacterium]PSR31804.1 MAG: hypothetical protein C7B43_00865 [Sulfobacillus benefaciens]
MRLTRHISYWLRWLIEVVILVTLATGIVAFFIHWGAMMVHPQKILLNLRGILEDIFTLALLVETRDLFRHLSPPRLLDIVATILARQLALAHNANGALPVAVAISLIVVVRGIWSRFLDKGDSEEA